MLHFELPPTDRTEVPHSLGFRILARKQQLKLDFDAGGLPLMEDFIDALIASGVDTEEDILDHVCEITGPTGEGRAQNVLNECENIHWVRCADGRYALSSGK